MRVIILFFVFIPWAVSFSQSVAQPKSAFDHPAYLGISGGAGSTTWEGLVPSRENKNDAISISTPTKVTEGGPVWGFFAGYELTRYFAIEASYMRYPSATVMFDEFSLFSFENDGELSLHTHTETASVMAKVMLMVPRTTVRVYSGAGAALVHRWDSMINDRRASPTFGFGFNYPFSEHVLGEFGVNYTAGYGESEINPANDYIPFLYSGFLRLAYRI